MCNNTFYYFCESGKTETKTLKTGLANSEEKVDAKSRVKQIPVKKVNSNSGKNKIPIEIKEKTGLANSKEKVDAKSRVKKIPVKKIPVMNDFNKKEIKTFNLTKMCNNTFYYFCSIIGKGRDHFCKRHIIGKGRGKMNQIRKVFRFSIIGKGRGQTNQIRKVFCFSLITKGDPLQAAMNAR
jgi:hypothetical protein